MPYWYNWKMIKFVAVSILITIATVIGFDFFDQNYSITTKTVPTQVPAPTPIMLSDRALWSLIQEWRTSEGRNPYIEDQRLCVIADDRVDDPYTHDGFYEKYNNYPYVLQENLSDGHPNEKSALTGWLDSPGHAETLRKPYKASCVRCLGDYCVQIFSNLDY
jgi:hypothetical protein